METNDHYAIYDSRLLLELLREIRDKTDYENGVTIDPSDPVKHRLFQHLKSQSAYLFEKRVIKQSHAIVGLSEIGFGRIKTLEAEKRKTWYITSTFWVALATLIAALIALFRC